MTSSAIPIPAELAYDRGLSPAALQTWIQLRGLAGETAETPRLNLAQLAVALGKSQSALYQHMALLRSRGVLQWRTAGKGQVVFSFAPAPASGGAFQHSTLPESTGLECASLNPLTDSQFDSEEGREAVFQPSGKRLPSPAASPGVFPGAATPEDEPGRDGWPPAVREARAAPQTGARPGHLARLPALPGSAPPADLPPAAREARAASQTGARQGHLARLPALPGSAPPDALPPERRGAAAPDPAADPQALPGDLPAELSAAALYQSLTRLRPNRAQRDLLQAQVSDLARWRSTLEHWLAHRWNPKNIPGMLDLYARGGGEHCNFCSPAEKPQSARRGASGSSHPPASLDALAELRRERERSERGA